MQSCSNCGENTDELYRFETESGEYKYCIICLKKAYGRLHLLLYKNKETRKLLKNLTKILKNEQKN